MTSCKESLPQLVIRAILAGNGSHRAIRGAMADHLALPELKKLLDQMHRVDGLIHSVRGGWNVSPRGLRLIPGATPAMTWEPYVPAAPMPRRPNSDHGHLPSLAGGQLYYRVGR